MLNNYKEDIERWEKIIKEFQELKELSQLIDDSEKEEFERKIEEFKKELEREEIKTFLSGRYDKGPALLSVFAGAGGQDAQDWVAILLRMYQKYCERKGFKWKILHQSFGEGVGPEGRIGLKQVSMEIKGPYAYGFLKNESGVHRLVRISPFSAKNLRHTSFALVEVLPKISKEDILRIDIKPEDLKIEFYKASGPGGQYVNKRETAVRIWHIPTGIFASCQSERSQAQNREKAMEILYSKLYKLREEQIEKELGEIKKKNISPSWGNQIRSYVFHPYKLVKDLRTGVEENDVEKVLDGEIDNFIEAETRIKNDQKRK